MQPEAARRKNGIHPPAAAHAVCSSSPGTNKGIHLPAATHAGCSSSTSGEQMELIRLQLHTWYAAQVPDDRSHCIFNSPTSARRSLCACAVHEAMVCQLLPILLPRLWMRAASCHIACSPGVQSLVRHVRLQMSQRLHDVLQNLRACRRQAFRHLQERLISVLWLSQPDCAPSGPPPPSLQWGASLQPFFQPATGADTQTTLDLHNKSCSREQLALRDTFSAQD